MLAVSSPGSDHPPGPGVAVGRVVNVSIGALGGGGSPTDVCAGVRAKAPSGDVLAAIIAPPGASSDVALAWWWWPTDRLDDLGDRLRRSDPAHCPVLLDR